MHSWGVSEVLAVFLVLAFVAGLILTLSIIVKRDQELECDRANQVRAQLLLLVALVIAVMVLVSQRYQLAHAVKHLME